jgi:Golgi nucleoside diphosphatase
VQRGQRVESINKLNQVFHFIDLTYTKQNIIFHGWIGYRTNEQIMQVLDGHFMNFYKQYKCKSMIIENSKMSGTFTEINDWLAGYFMPKMISMGLKNNAVVLPQNIFSKLAVEDWIRKRWFYNPQLWLA